MFENELTHSLTFIPLRSSNSFRFSGATKDSIHATSIVLSSCSSPPRPRPLPGPSAALSRPVPGPSPAPAPPPAPSPARLRPVPGPSTARDFKSHVAHVLLIQVFNQGLQFGSSNKSRFTIWLKRHVALDVGSSWNSLHLVINLYTRRVRQAKRLRREHVRRPRHGCRRDE